MPLDRTVLRRNFTKANPRIRGEQTIVLDDVARGLPRSDHFTPVRGDGLASHLAGVSERESRLRSGLNRLKEHYRGQQRF